VKTFNYIQDHIVPPINDARTPNPDTPYIIYWYNLEDFVLSIKCFCPYRTVFKNIIIGKQTNEKLNIHTNIDGINISPENIIPNIGIIISITLLVRSILHIKFDK
jgi:hypothetical protein